MLLFRCLLLLILFLQTDRLQAAEPRDIVFNAACDQTEQCYVLIEPENFLEQPQRDLLIALHGHGSDRWQFINSDRDEARATRGFAEKHHLLYVSPDYRAKTSWMGPAAEADLLQIITELKEKYALKRVFLSGGSMGGTSAMTFAAMHPELIQGVAAMNPHVNHLEYQGFQEAIAESFGGSKAEIPFEYKKRSAEYWPEKLTMPVALTTGGKDTIVPPDSTLRLAAVLKTLNRPVLIVHREAGGHSTTYDDGLQILEFMLENAKTVEP